MKVLLMIYTSTMTSKGQVVIPKPIRDALKFTRQRRIQISQRVIDGKEVAIVESVPDIRDMAGKFKPKRKVVDPVKIRAYMETHYERA